MDDVTIWRYMDLAKFVDLISTQQVFFCRSDKLGDPFEGSCPKKYHDTRLEEIRRESKNFTKEVELYSHVGLEFRKYVFLNCWHMGEHESAALWRLYMKSNEGIAIRSSRNRLNSAFMDSGQNVFSVKVLYIDYATADVPMPTMIAPFRYKRNSFKHEQEIRYFVYAHHQDAEGRHVPPPSNTGIRVKADIRTLIESVYVAPTAPDWVRSLIARLCTQFGVEAPVLRSSLSTDDPIFIV